MGADRLGTCAGCSAAYCVNLSLLLTTAKPVGHIIFRVEELPTGVFREVDVPGSCTVVHGAKVAMPTTVDVYIDVRSDWFSQDDTRRAYLGELPG